jgi:hypothetical protein
MSELTEGLGRIYSWFAEKIPDRISQIVSGISLEEIDEKVQELPFKVPNELYELYQWHNGSSGYKFLFESYEFMSLGQAVREYKDEILQLKYDECEEVEFFQHRFPIFELWYDRVFYTIVPNEQGNSPLHIYDMEMKDYSLRYYKLTDMILHGAAWCDSAKFIESEQAWRVDDEIKFRSDVKYMAREYIIDFINRSGTAGFQKSVYQSCLNTDVG